MDKIFITRRNIITSFILALLVFTVFFQVTNHDFLNYDDDVYITKNRHVQEGLTLEGILWAFTAIPSGNWHPLTWLSHMLDIELYGLNPAGHHFTSLLFHILNTLLLFFILKRMTGAFWRSIFVSALFALHPLHVESVAWVTERKDVLSTFFWMLVMLTYAVYVKKGGASRYLLVLFFFTLGLMSKPMLVTLPFVLLLLDYWPLGRFQFSGLKSSTAKSKNTDYGLTIYRLFLEKIPFFILLAISSTATFLAELYAESVVFSKTFPLNTRIFNALIAYISYLGKMIWPHHLGVFYPYPDRLPIWKVLGAAFLLIFISLLVIRELKRLPYLFVGWFWYLGTLVPVIGFIQTGSQSMADRYTYIPLIGVFIIIAWGIPDLLKGWRYQRIILSISSGIILLLLTIFTWFQASHWQNSITLFKHTLKVTTHNNIAHNNLGTALAKEGRLKEAAYHFREALKGKPDFFEAHYNLGTALALKGKPEEAVYHLREALKGQSGLPDIHNKLGKLLTRQRKFNEAIYHFRKALEIKPDFVDVHNNLGIALGRLGKLEETIYHFREALRIKPNDAKAHNNLGVTLGLQGKIEEAIYHFRKALEIKPDFTDAENNLRKALSLKKKF